MQTIWHDNDGRVKAVYDGDTNSTVWADRGYSKAVSDPDQMGKITQDYVVAVSDGVVSSATYDPLPTPDSVWYERIERRADDEIGKGVSYTDADGNSYTIRTGPSARSLIAGAHSAAERAERLGNTLSRKVPTQNRGVVAFDRADLIGIFEAVEARHQGVMDRVEELHAMVEDGTINEEELSAGWP